MRTRLDLLKPDLQKTVKYFGAKVIQWGRILLLQLHSLTSSTIEIISLTIKKTHYNRHYCHKNVTKNFVRVTKLMSED